METQLGKVSDTEYLTPFQITIIFNPKSILETAFSLVLDRAQLIHTDVHISHPSPQLLVFDKPTIDDRKKYHDNGFQQLIIIDYTNQTISVEQLNSKNVDNYTQIITRLDSILEYIDVSPYGAFILDHLLMAKFPDEYKPIFSEINTTNARLFARAMEKSHQELVKICSASYKVYTMMNEIISRESAVKKNYTSIIEQRLADGFRYILGDTNVIAVSWDSLCSSSLRDYQQDEKLGVIITYKKNITGWNVQIFGDLSSIDSYKTGIVSFEDACVLCPFLRD